jgi:hypothetical protein
MSSNSVKARWSARHCIASERRHTVTTKHHRQKIARDLPALGTTLTGRFKGQTYSATIVAAEDSPTGKAVEHNGKRYTSPSAAAKAVTGHSINGWLFWNIMTGD